MTKHPISLLTTILYPFVIFFGFRSAHWPLAVTALLALLGVQLFICRKDAAARASTLVLMCILVVSLWESAKSFSLYAPVVINAFLLLTFASSLTTSQSIIERFARMQHPDLPEAGQRYCRTVTMVWCVFFFCNGCIAYYTARYSSIEVWTFYNGFLAYILIGALFGIELMFRRYHQRRHALLGLAMLIGALGNLGGITANADDSIFTEPPAQESSLSKLHERLSQAAVVRAAFTQTKSVEGLQRPVESSGTILIAKNQGILWKTEQPFPSTLVITESGIRRADETARQSGRGSRLEREVARVFLGMFEGSFPQLQTHFQHFLRMSGPAQWTLGLKPKQKRMREFISHLVIRGTETVEQVTITEPASVTSIQFTNMQTSSDPLSSAERAQFEN